MTDEKDEACRGGERNREAGLVRTAALVATVLLAGCADQTGDPSICTAPLTLMNSLKDRDAPLLGADGEGQRIERMVRLESFAGECVHRWSYRLSVAPGSNREIAEAARNACDDPIRAWAVDAGARYQEDLSQALLDRRGEMLSRALFHVVQARAGKCKASKEGGAQ